MTHREFASWLEWLSLQWNRPSRSDYYLMRIAQRVQQVLSGKSASKITTDHQKLKFSSSEAPKTREEAAEDSKSQWMRALKMSDIARKKVGGSQVDRVARSLSQPRQRGK